MTIVLPDREALLQIHRMTLDRHGGAAGIRDGGALDAALARPRQIEAYDDRATLFDLTAALVVSLTRHRHPFVDGNKRMGLIAAYVTLELNNFHLDATETDAHVALLGVAEGQMSETEFSDWLKRHAVAITP